MCTTTFCNSNHYYYGLDVRQYCKCYISCSISVKRIKQEHSVYIACMQHATVAEFLPKSRMIHCSNITAALGGMHRSSPQQNDKKAHLCGPKCITCHGTMFTGKLTWLTVATSLLHWGKYNCSSPQQNDKKAHLCGPKCIESCHMSWDTVHQKARSLWQHHCCTEKNALFFEMQHGTMFVGVAIW